MNKTDKPITNSYPKWGDNVLFVQPGQTYTSNFSIVNKLYIDDVCTYLCLCSISQQKPRDAIAWKYPTSYLKKKAGAESDHSEKMN